MRYKNLLDREQRQWIEDVNYLLDNIAHSIPEKWRSPWLRRQKAMYLNTYRAHNRGEVLFTWAQHLDMGDRLKYYNNTAKFGVASKAEENKIVKLLANIRSYMCELEEIMFAQLMKHIPASQGQEYLNVYYGKPEKTLTLVDPAYHALINMSLSTCLNTEIN